MAKLRDVAIATMETDHGALPAKAAHDALHTAVSAVNFRELAELTRSAMAAKLKVV